MYLTILYNNSSSEFLTLGGCWGQVRMNSSCFFSGGVCPEEHTNLEEAYRKMQQAVERDMPKVPMFAGYFELLKMITFSTSLAPSLIKMGRMPAECADGQEPARFAADYIRPFPRTMPPIPLQKLVPYKVNINFVGVCQQIRNKYPSSEPSHLDCWVKDCILTGERGDLTEQIVQEVEQACEGAIIEGLIQLDPSLAGVVRDEILGFDRHELQVQQCTIKMMQDGVHELLSLCLGPILPAIGSCEEMVGSRSLPHHSKLKTVKLGWEERSSFIRAEFLPAWKECFDAQTEDLCNNRAQKVHPELERPLLNNFLERCTENDRQRDDALAATRQKIKELNVQHQECKEKVRRLGQTDIERKLDKAYNDCLLQLNAQISDIHAQHARILGDYREQVREIRRKRKVHLEEEVTTSLQECLQTAECVTQNTLTRTWIWENIEPLLPMIRLPVLDFGSPGTTPCGY